MYFPEFSPRVEGEGTVLRVAWLEGSEPYKRGEFSESLLEKLLVLAATKRVLQTRGFHCCTLCAPGSDRQVVVEHLGRSIYLGSAELWIPCDEEKWFACPDLIVHYVKEHEYLPPADFTSAIARLCVDDPTYAPAAFVEDVRERAWAKKQGTGG